MFSITVIIPTFNRARSLERALKSVTEQSFPPNEILVIDDGSEDDTSAMIAEKFPQVIYHYQPNRGVSSARNRAIQLARSEWLTFLDSDDQWLPEKLQQQCEQFSKNPNYKICHTEEIWVRQGMRVNAMKKHAKRGGDIFKYCLPLCVMSPSSIMIHRSVFETVGLFDETLPACEDYDLWLRITAHYPVLFIEEAMIIKYGGHQDQLSRRYWGMDRFRIQAMQKLLQQDSLNHQHKQLVLKELHKKSRIYAQGAAKRNKQDEANHYFAIADSAQSHLEGILND